MSRNRKLEREIESMLNTPAMDKYMKDLNKKRPQEKPLYRSPESIPTTKPLKPAKGQMDLFK